MLRMLLTRIRAVPRFVGRLGDNTINLLHWQTYDLAPAIRWELPLVGGSSDWENAFRSMTKQEIRKIWDDLCRENSDSEVHGALLERFRKMMRRKHIFVHAVSVRGLESHEIPPVRTYRTSGLELN